MFITKNAVVTTHLQNLPIIQALVSMLRSNPDLLARGPARIAHFVLDGAVDAYFPVLDQLDEFVDEIEERVFGKFDEELRPVIKRAGLLTRDPRVKERKKVGLKRARKAPQYTKR